MCEVTVSISLSQYRKMEAKIKAFDLKYTYVQIRAEHINGSELYVINDSPEVAANELLMLKDKCFNLDLENYKLKNPSWGKPLKKVKNNFFK